MKPEFLFPRSRTLHCADWCVRNGNARQYIHTLWRSESNCSNTLDFCSKRRRTGAILTVSCALLPVYRSRSLHALTLALSPYLPRSQHRLCFHLNFASLSSYARTRSSSSMRPQHAAKKKQSEFRPILLTGLLSHYAADAERENWATALSHSRALCRACLLLHLTGWERALRETAKKKPVRCWNTLSENEDFHRFSRNNTRALAGHVERAKSEFR